MANNLIDDRLWDIRFEGDKIFVYNIHLYVRGGISLAFSNSDGIVVTVDNYRNKSVSTKCFNLIAPVDKFELNDELNQGLADFFTIIFGMSYRASLTIISYSNISLTDDL